MKRILSLCVAAPNPSHYPTYYPPKRSPKPGKIDESKVFPFSNGRNPVRFISRNQSCLFVLQLPNSLPTQVSDEKAYPFRNDRKLNLFISWNQSCRFVLQLPHATRRPNTAGNRVSSTASGGTPLSGRDSLHYDLFVVVDFFVSHESCLSWHLQLRVRNPHTSQYTESSTVFIESSECILSNSSEIKSDQILWSL